MGEAVNARMLMRHALGRPNAQKCSYRNRYAATRGTRQHELWMVLVAAKQATLANLAADRDMFSLTREGAEDALAPGERLDCEDFPVSEKTN